MAKALPFLLRMAGYFAFWVVLAGVGTKDLIAGVLTAALAGCVSLALLPPGELSLRPMKVVWLFLRFLGQSVTAGVAVARIALSPRMALEPGMMRYRTRLSTGNRRLAFMTFASLLPGTLPVETSEGETIDVHVLDLGQPVQTQLEAEEEKLAAVFSQEVAA